jgi:hypothetical protein
MDGKEEKKGGSTHDFQKERNEKKGRKERVERKVNTEGENKQSDSEERQNR